jgi:hypothetical protein
MVPREVLVEQSVQDFVKAGFVARGIGPTQVVVRDSFPTATERATPLTVTTVAIGINFDDGGKFIELGSDLTERVYTVECWTFGTGKNIAQTTGTLIRAMLEETFTVPLIDVTQVARPVIDQLALQDRRRVSVTRQLAREPLPWDRFVYSTVARLEDVYSPSLVD